MPKIFDGLSREEKEKLIEGIALITVLIAGSDGVISEKEKAWAEKVTEIRSYQHKETLTEYYLKVGENFQDNLTRIIESVSEDTDTRNIELSDRIAALNPILAKMDPDIAHDLLKDYRSFAKHVAKAAGGFLSFGSISHEEKKWIKLEMLEEIHF